MGKETARLTDSQLETDHLEQLNRELGLDIKEIDIAAFAYFHPDKDCQEIDIVPIDDCQHDGSTSFIVRGEVPRDFYSESSHNTQKLLEKILENGTAIIETNGDLNSSQPSAS